MQGILFYCQRRQPPGGGQAVLRHGREDLRAQHGHQLRMFFAHALQDLLQRRGKSPLRKLRSGGGYGGVYTGTGGGGYGVDNYGRGGNSNYDNTTDVAGKSGICIITWTAQEA